MHGDAFDSGPGPNRMHLMNTKSGPNARTLDALDALDPCGALDSDTPESGCGVV